MRLPPTADELTAVHASIVRCTRCRRLRTYCQRVAREKKRAHAGDTYWARPVPGFGDPRARLLILGLAPAAHGANRTGRVFTGDGSGDFLMRALFETGFANLSTSRHPEDGLALKDAYIAAAVRCAPPDNKPTLDEIRACQPHLDAEWRALGSVRVIVALGGIAFDAAKGLLTRVGYRVERWPRFAHGVECLVPGGPRLLASYHPSRQNTNTGRLTAGMLGGVFERARAGLDPH
jgi:uracil-DNA glycosylase family 4